MIRAFTFLIISLLHLSPASGHEVRPGFLEIEQIGADQFNVLFKVPALGENRLGLDIRLPDTCDPIRPVTIVSTGDAFVERSTINCSDGLDGKIVSVDGLDSTLTDVIVRVALADGSVQSDRLTPIRTQFEIDGTPSWHNTAWTYFELGVDHILFGFDHLLFVLTLLLLIRSTRTLIETITAFTLAHSITLVATALGWLAIPQAPVEAVIALSIAFVAAEVVRQGRGASDVAIRKPWIIAFMFGLLHGFGFGGALKEIGLPHSDVPLALLTFNLGVEAGQLLFVFAILALRGITTRLVKIDLNGFRLISTYAIGSLAAAWFVQRLFVLG